MKRVSETNHDNVVEIPAVLRVGIVRVQPPLAVVVPLDVEHVRIAIGIDDLYAYPSRPPPFEYSWG